MWLIAGLGNPERKYIGTRHNAGFAAIDKLLIKLDAGGLNDTKFKGAFTKISFEEKKLIIIKPLTYMNLSGQCIAPMASFYKIPPQNIIVIVDDIALPVGRIRVRPSGSAGGHNGLKSIIEALGTEDFPRVRIGVGAVDGTRDMIGHVLSGFAPEQKEIMEDSFTEAALASLDIMSFGIDKAMNLHNGKK